jgi:hypothetical protein
MVYTLFLWSPARSEIGCNSNDMLKYVITAQLSSGHHHNFDILAFINDKSPT